MVGTYIRFLKDGSRFTRSGVVTALREREQRVIIGYLLIGKQHREQGRRKRRRSKAGCPA